MRLLLAVVIGCFWGLNFAYGADFEVDLLAAEQSRNKDIAQTIAQVTELEVHWPEMQPSQQVRLLILKAFIHIYAANYPEATAVLRRAESLTSDKLLLAEIYNYKATALILIKNYQEALEVLSRSLALIDFLSEDDSKRKAYLRVASLYSSMGLTDMAADYAAKALLLVADVVDVKAAKQDAINKELEDKCLARMFLAEHTLVQGLFEKAYHDFAEVRQFCQSSGLPLVANMALGQMGQARFNAGQYRDAEPLLVEALKGYDKFQYKMEISSIHALLALNYQALGRPDDAIRHAQWVIAQVDEPSYIEHKQDAYQVLSELAAQAKEFEPAYGYGLLAQHYKQMVLDETKIKALAYQSAKFNSDEKEREITLLNKERELYIAQQTAKEREYANMLMFITILVGGLFFLGILLVVGSVQKRRFMRMARMDALTGVLNRGAGQELGENLFVQVLARGGDFCVILFDLDYFKRINDSYGHGTGDWALKKVVEVLKPHIRHGDIFARIGGEEFLILLPYANEEKAMELAQLYRERIEAIDTQYSGHRFKITASFGVTGLRQDDLSLDPLLNRADMALYNAKSSGRNRVNCYSISMASDKQATTLGSHLVSTL
ncbi:MAG: tetratricopeptide repeat-containing diguanylate cyclase [Shewanella sp.]